MQLNSKHPELYSSFKLTVLEADTEKIRAADLWAQGIRLDRFFLRREAPRNRSDEAGADQHS